MNRILLGKMARQMQSTLNLIDMIIMHAEAYRLNGPEAINEEDLEKITRSARKCWSDEMEMMDLIIASGAQDNDANDDVSTREFDRDE